MSIDPKTQSATTLRTDSLQINALDPDKLMAFYRDNIGFTLLAAQKGKAPYKLGTSNGVVILEIHQTNERANRTHAGLYHFALRLPTRKDLAAILMHMVQSNTRLTGASDHGYSNALYLNDPEGNGIEIYWDKDESEWDVLDNGEIAGVTLRLDLDELVSLLTPEDQFHGVPNGSDLGHMHLHVFDLKASWAFYRRILGLGLKYIYGEQAIFTATGSYHHHLGMNTWRGTNLEPITDGEQGLKSYTWVGTAHDLATVKNNLESNDVAFTESTDGQLTFKDNSGFTVNVKVG